MALLDGNMGQMVYLLLVVGAGVGVAIAAWTLARLGTAMARKTEGSLDDKLAKALRLPLAVFAGLLAAGVGLVLLQGRIEPGILGQSRRVLAALFLILAGWGLARVLRSLLERAGERRNRFQPASRVASRLVAIVVYTLAFLMVLSVYGLSITPVLTGLGIAGLAVALALQDTGANFFAGIWIQTGKALQPGHYIRIEEKDERLEGFVEEVGWRVTRIRTLAGNTIVVPNNKLAQSVTTDYNLPDKTMNMGIRFRVAFEADPDLVMRVLVEEAKAMMEEHEGLAVAGREPFANLADIAEDAHVYEVSFRVTEFVQVARAQQILRLRVLRRFHKEKIRIPYPTKHNLQEPVAAPKARRKPEGPGGLAPGRRPPRPKAKEPKPPVDPFLQEAEKAKQEIEAAQREKEAEAKGDDEPPEKPPEKPAEADAAKAAAAATVAAGDGKAPAMPSPKDDERRAAKDSAGTDASDDGGEKPANPLTRTG